MLYFLDSDRNVVESSRANLDNASDEPFSEASLIGVSEISLVTPDVLQTATDLQRNLGLAVWDGAGSDMFSAVGDENCLFIVVKAGRVGLASTLPALPLPTQVMIAGVSRIMRVRWASVKRGVMTTERR
jgi:hypothetical protein